MIYVIGKYDTLFKLYSQKRFQIINIIFLKLWFKLFFIKRKMIFRLSYIDRISKN